jgi:hypothetical protein
MYIFNKNISIKDNKKILKLIYDGANIQQNLTKNILIYWEIIEILREYLNKNKIPEMLDFNLNLIKLTDEEKKYFSLQEQIECVMYDINGDKQELHEINEDLKKFNNLNAFIIFEIPEFKPIII